MFFFFLVVLYYSVKIFKLGGYSKLANFYNYRYLHQIPICFPQVYYIIICSGPEMDTSDLGTTVGITGLLYD